MIFRISIEPGRSSIGTRRPSASLPPNLPQPSAVPSANLCSKIGQRLAEGTAESCGRFGGRLAEGRRVAMELPSGLYIFSAAPISVVERTASLTLWRAPRTARSTPWHTVEGHKRGAP